MLLLIILLNESLIAAEQTQREDKNHSEPVVVTQDEVNAFKALGR